MVENFRFRNISMETAGYPIFIRLSNHPAVMVEAVRNLEFENVTAKSPQLPFLMGRPDAPIRDIRFVGCKFQRTDTAWCEKRPCTGWIMTPGHNYDPLPMTVQNAERIRFVDTEIDS